MRPKDVFDSSKQYGVVYKIPCEGGKVYIGETGTSMHERIKEYERSTETYDLLVPKPLRFQNRLPNCPFQFGTRLCLLIHPSSSQKQVCFLVLIEAFF